MEGLCLIPEGVNSGLNVKGKIYEISNIKNIDKYLTFADKKNLGVVYISTEFGVVYADEEVTYSKKKLYKYTLCERKIWSKIVAEQVFRKCLNYSTSKVYLLIDYKSVYGELVTSMRELGIQVIIPFVKER